MEFVGHGVPQPTRLAFLLVVPARLSRFFDRFRNAEHNADMIHSFTCLDTEALFRSQSVPRFKNIERVARRKLLQIHAATELASLRVPPGNQLEALKGDRRGQHSIRINDQWRICFAWHDDGARQVEIVDYH